MSSDSTFGRAARETASVEDFLALERAYGHGERFAWIDQLVEDAIRRFLRQRLEAPPHALPEFDSLPVSHHDPTLRHRIDDHFSLPRQQSRGAWFLPEDGLAESPDAVLRWSILDPLVAGLTRPFALRDLPAGSKDREWQLRAWEETDEFLTCVGFHLSDKLQPLRYGGGWSKLRAHEREQTRHALTRAIRDQADAFRAVNYRVLRFRQLLDLYYDRARSGPPKMRRVLTADLQRVIAGYFGGDWLAFLRYIGEPPHEDERIATVLPEPKLRVVDTSRIASLAEQFNLSAEEVESILSAMWGTDTPASPIELRVNALRRFWDEYDAILGRHESGDASLWGLVDDGGMRLTDAPGQPYRHRLYDRLLSDDLLATIDELWGTVLLPRRPAAMVSAVSAHELFREAFGPAITFWHGCALTAWFICEGPYSRTDLSGMAEYYRRDLAALASKDAPVSGELFRELLGAERYLGPPEPIYEKTSTQQVHGLTVSIGLSRGARRDGYAILRDIITRHRRAWAAQHLDAYLATQWQSELGAAARSYYLLFERKGRAPTAREFAPSAESVANLWFGGDLGAVYQAFGEPSPVNPAKNLLMPRDRVLFARRVLEELRTRSAATREPPPPGTEWSPLRPDQVERSLEILAERSIQYVQLEEAHGRPPTLAEFGRAGFAYRSEALAPELETAWVMYQEAVHIARSAAAVAAPIHSEPADTPFQPEPVTTPREEPSSDRAQTAGGEPAGRSLWKRLLGRR